jgi:arginine-tRNA-protein transferase
MTGTPGTDLIFVNEEFFAESITAAQLDSLLSDGWRHFGIQFYRYSLGICKEEIRRVIPLRIRLAKFEFSKSQRRVLRKNIDLHTVIRPIEITTETEHLFHRHKLRFEEGVPISIYEFLSQEPSVMPCEAKEVAVYRDENLVAVSYFDVGERSLSGIYAMFDPREHSRSLGIFTMLKEIEYARERSCEFYYQGYAYEGESFYDYKKRFNGLECFDWRGRWEEFSHRDHRDNDNE